MRPLFFGISISLSRSIRVGTGENMKLYIGILILIGMMITLNGFSAEAGIPKWKVKVQEVIKNEDGTVTLVYPHRYGPYFDDDTLICGGPGSVEYSPLYPKNKICNKLGFGKYIKGSMKTFNHAVLMIDAVTERIISNGWWCEGAPVGVRKGIKSIQCEQKIH